MGPTGSLEPLSASSYRLQLNISKELQEKLELARDLMSHANPSGDLALVVERSLELLIAKLQARRFGQTKRPHPGRDISVSGAKPSAGAEVHGQEQAHGQEQVHGQEQEQTQTPTKVEAPARRRRHIVNEVRRQLLARDGARCSYVASDGRRCCARAFLELDHARPWAKGGADSVANLRLLCRAHNLFLAEKEFGAELVRRPIVQRQRRGRRAA